MDRWDATDAAAKRLEAALYSDTGSSLGRRVNTGFGKQYAVELNREHY